MDSIKFMLHVICFWGILLAASCEEQKMESVTRVDSDTIAGSIDVLNQQHQKKARKKNPIDFLPDGFVIFEKLYGDLNDDGVDDCLLIIKGTDVNQIITEDDGVPSDRNRRGIIVLFKENDYYELITENIDCFSSENEDGGVYYAPQVSFEINRGNLEVHFEHGRYGYWRYYFRQQGEDFDLIAFVSSDGGAISKRKVSYDFLTNIKHIRESINDNPNEGDTVYTEFLEELSETRLLKLSEIRDFDELILMLVARLMKITNKHQSL
jgi:hypothetical protein